jgi:beta-aspartyl-peptidase (threonine type)
VRRRSHESLPHVETRLLPENEMRPLPFLALLISLAAVPAAHAAEPAIAVKELLNAQVAAWNSGDLKGFMEGYWNSPELTLFVAGDIHKGWQETYQRYQNEYQKGGREMGRLTLDGLSFDPLSDDAVVARGRWKLTMKDCNLGGLFTLIVRRMPEGWRIVHDHTSAAEPVKDP